jgi:hypothetical protein
MQNKKMQALVSSKLTNPIFPDLRLKIFKHAIDCHFIKVLGFTKSMIVDRRRLG